VTSEQKMNIPFITVKSKKIQIFGALVDDLKAANHSHFNDQK